MMKMKTKTHIGIDYSITCPCVCISNNATDFMSSSFYFLSDKKVKTGSYDNIKSEAHSVYSLDQERYDNISNWVLKLIAPLEKDRLYIMMEDYSFGSKGKVFNLAENFGLLKHKLYKGGYKFSTVAPTVVKKFATGKGNANKEIMYDAFVKDTSLNLNQVLSPKSTKVGSPVNDIVDSWYICRYSEVSERGE